VALESSLLQRMSPVFEHLLRNAVAHGLESASERTRRNKKSMGEISLSFYQEGNELVFELNDDGAGLNYAALRDKALEKGLLQAKATASEDQLAQLIFVPGLSTAGEITEISGRGIGMDVVRSEIGALGGRIDVKSQRGAGTQFIMRLPDNAD
jgi:chemosensory pili system protein ChpA (sensor histidine kinase/response regulator)